MTKTDPQDCTYYNAPSAPTEEERVQAVYDAGWKAALAHERSRAQGEPVAVASGWVLVPVEPTDEMKARVRANGGPQALAFALAAWPDLLAAAPVAPPAESGEVDPVAAYKISSVEMPNGAVQLVARLGGAAGATPIGEIYSHNNDPEGIASRLVDGWNGALCSPSGRPMKMLASRDWLRAKIATDPDMDCEAATPPTESGEVDCQNCAGNGEIVTDWDRYLHSHPGDTGDEAVAECTDCDGTGKVSTLPAPPPEPAKAEVVVKAMERTDDLHHDAARWRALARNTGAEADFSRDPAGPHTLHIKIDVSGCEVWINDKVDFVGTLERAMDAEISEFALGIDTPPAAPAAARSAAEWKPTHRHIKSDRLERVIGEASAQVSKDSMTAGGRGARMLCDGDALTVYEGADRRLWARFTDEFNDGRFIPLPGEEA